MSTYITVELTTNDGKPAIKLVSILCRLEPALNRTSYVLNANLFERHISQVICKDVRPMFGLITKIDEIIILNTIIQYLGDVELRIFST